MCNIVKILPCEFSPCDTSIKLNIMYNSSLETDKKIFFLVLKFLSFKTHTKNVYSSKNVTIYLMTSYFVTFEGNVYKYETVIEFK